MATDNTPGRILGIGGVFFKSRDANALRSWYAGQFGFAGGEDGNMFPWLEKDGNHKEQLTVWSIFPQDSKYFDPSTAPFMINYIVDDLDALLAKLSAKQVSIDPKREDHEYGRFAWIYDPDGNKIELWEPPKA